MKNILVFLLALIVAPVWAEDVSVAPSTTEPFARPTQAAPGSKANCVQLAFLSTKPSTKALPQSADGSSEPGCPTGCMLMNCPPPSGPVQCCNTSTFQPC